MMSRYGDQAHVPVRGWHYFDGEDWLEDLYLTMSGTYHISACDGIMGL